MSFRRAMKSLRPIVEALRDLAPIILVILFFQELVLRQPIPHMEKLLVGLVFVLAGLALFVRGLKIGLFPVGEAMANSFVAKGSAFWLLLFAFLLGFSTTIAEPALIAIADKAAEIAADGGMIEPSQQAMQDYSLGLRITVAVSVGVAILLGVLRIIFDWPLHYCIIAGYCLVVAMTSIAPVEIIGIAYDSGGVTTSTITVPMVTALGIGLASSIRGRSPIVDGFGLIAFASLLPMIFVMAYGMWVLS